MNQAYGRLSTHVLLIWALLHSLGENTPWLVCLFVSLGGRFSTPELQNRMESYPSNSFPFGPSLPNQTASSSVKSNDVRQGYWAVWNVLLCFQAKQSSLGWDTGLSWETRQLSRVPNFRWGNFVFKESIMEKHHLPCTQPTCCARQKSTLQDHVH